MDYAQFEKPDFYDKYTRALNECQQRGSTILYCSAYLVAGIASIVTAALIVADVDPVLLIFIVPMVMVSLFFGKKTGDMYYKLDFSNTRDGRTGSYAKRVFYEKKYAGELRLFGIGKLLLHRHEKAYDEMQKRTREIRRKITVLETVKWVIYNLLYTIFPYLYIAFVLNSEGVQTAAYIAMIPALGTLSWRTSDAVELVVTLAKESAFVANLREFLSYEPKTNSSMRPSPALDDIEIKNMSFTYDGAEKPTLHNVNMTIKKGEKIAVVGHNGAGKTTLVKLIMGLYPVTDGEISISGANINEYEPKSFHRHFGTVFQDLQVFTLPLSENVLMRKPKNDEERKLIEDSLRKAQFGDKLDTLEKGIDTMVTKEFSESGTMLSGGESQKAAISRIFMRDTPIAILDEPSSALDPIAEYRLNKNMLENAENQAVILISHRLSTTKDADRIILLEHGQIAESGTHSELLANGGRYAEMWDVQAEKYGARIFA